MEKIKKAHANISSLDAFVNNKIRILYSILWDLSRGFKKFDRKIF